MHEPGSVELATMMVARSKAVRDAVTRRRTESIAKSMVSKGFILALSFHGFPIDLKAVACDRSGIVL